MGACASVNGVRVGQCPAFPFNSDVLFQFLDAESAATTPPTPITGATCSVSLYDDGTGALILGPVAMPALAAPNDNDYQGSVLMSAANGFSVGQIVRAVITLDGGPGLMAESVLIGPIAG